MSKRSIIITLLVIILGVSLIVAVKEVRQRKNFSNKAVGEMMTPFQGYQDQFVLPQDAIRSGEIRMIVDNLEAVSQRISYIAQGFDGRVYATNISYQPNRTRTGYVIVQIPASSFDNALNNFKSVAAKVVQESSQQIEQRYRPMVVYENSNTDSKNSNENSDSKSDIIAPTIYPPLMPLQDKGYIKIFFMEKSANQFFGGAGKQTFWGMGYMGLNMRNNVWVVLAVKSIVLIVLIALLIVIIKKLSKTFKLSSQKNKTVEVKRETRVHVVRQAPKTRARVVRIAKRK